VLRSPGEALPPEVRERFEFRLGRDFSGVRVHSDDDAARSATEIGAAAYAVGPHIAFGAGRYAPGTATGQRLLAHELAHVAQDAAAGGGLSARRLLHRQPTDLGAYPVAERRVLRQSTVAPTQIDAAFLLELFGTAAQNGGAITTVPFGGTTVYGTGIPATLRRGLQSTGATLAQHSNVLPLNSTITLELDLTRFGGTIRHYRFTHLTHTEPHGRPGPLLLIEDLGAAPAAVAPVAVPTGPFRVGGHPLTVGAGWTDARFGGLVAVLGRLPDSVLTEAEGTTFALRGRGTANEAGHYDAAQDTIEMHENAFPDSPIRFGDADAGMRAITHEIGHLLDLRRLQRSWATFDAGGQTAAGKRNLEAARSLSGTRWRLPPGAGALWEQVDQRMSVRAIAFRQAAGRDGIRPGATATDPLIGAPTAYGNTDWQELFAESFSLYVDDPALFRLIRPNLFAWFTREFPLPATRATYAPGAAPTGAAPAAVPP
jgi:hypothetical protein